MAFQFERIIEAGLLEAVIPHVVLQDILACEALASFSREYFQKNDSWYGVACREVHSFTLNIEKRLSKLDLKSFLPELRKAVSMEPFPMPLASIRDASEMAAALGKFQGKARSHLSKGGSLAKVLVGRFRFDGSQSFFDRAQMRLKKSMPDIIFSQAITMEWAHTSLEEDHTSFALTMAFEKKKNVMLMNAELTSECELSKNSSRLVMDVRAMSPALLLQMRDVNIKPDGSRYESGSGLCLSKCNLAALDASLMEGIVCVLLVRDESDADRNASAFGPLAGSLNLDRVHLK